MTKHYALGFPFALDKSRLVLIKKDRPQWQAGKFNGVGGKLEPNEFPHMAMAREFKEETGVETEPNDWKEFASMTFHNDNMGGMAIVHCFSIFSDSVLEAKTMETEEVHVNSLSQWEVYKYQMMENVPMLLEIALNESLSFCDIQFN